MPDKKRDRKVNVQTQMPAEHWSCFLGAGTVIAVLEGRP